MSSTSSSAPTASTPSNAAATTTSTNAIAPVVANSSSSTAAATSTSKSAAAAVVAKKTTVAPAVASSSPSLPHVAVKSVKAAEEEASVAAAAATALEAAALVAAKAKAAARSKCDQEEADFERVYKQLEAIISCPETLPQTSTRSQSTVAASAISEPLNDVVRSKNSAAMLVLKELEKLVEQLASNNSNQTISSRCFVEFLRSRVSTEAAKQVEDLVAQATSGTPATAQQHQTDVALLQRGLIASTSGSKNVSFLTSSAYSFTSRKLKIVTGQSAMEDKKTMEHDLLALDEALHEAEKLEVQLKQVIGASAGAAVQTNSKPALEEGIEQRIKQLESLLADAVPQAGDTPIQQKEKRDLIMHIEQELVHLQSSVDKRSNEAFSLLAAEHMASCKHAYVSKGSLVGLSLIREMAVLKPRIKSLQQTVQAKSSTQPSVGRTPIAASVAMPVSVAVKGDKSRSHSRLATSLEVARIKTAEGEWQHLFCVSSSSTVRMLVEQLADAFAVSFPHRSMIRFRSKLQMVLDDNSNHKETHKLASHLSSTLFAQQSVPLMEMESESASLTATQAAPSSSSSPSTYSLEKAVCKGVLDVLVHRVSNGNEVSLQTSDALFVRAVDRYFFSSPSHVIPSSNSGIQSKADSRLARALAASKMSDSIVEKQLLEYKLKAVVEHPLSPKTHVKGKPSYAKKARIIKSFDAQHTNEESLSPMAESWFRGERELIMLRSFLSPALHQSLKLAFAHEACDAFVLFFAAWAVRFLETRAHPDISPLELGRFLIERGFDMSPSEQSAPVINDEAISDTLRALRFVRLLKKGKKENASVADITRLLTSDARLEKCVCASNGKTVLHLACESRLDMLVLTLLQRGVVDREAKDEVGRKAIEYASADALLLFDRFADTISVDGEAKEKRIATRKEAASQKKRPSTAPLPV